MDGFPSYSRAERIADNCLHALGVGAGLIGAAVLLVVIIQQANALLTLGVLLYVSGLMAMLVSSALYNVAGPSPRKVLFQRLDHAAIFVMIAGTYTPFALNVPDSAPGHRLLAFVWSVALTGAALKLWAPRVLRGGVSTVLYLLLGWCGVVAFDPLFAPLSNSALILLATGGVLYSLGAAFHHIQRLPFHNAIWHGFVLVAAACHYVAILDSVVLNRAAA